MSARQSTLFNANPLFNDNFSFHVLFLEHKKNFAHQTPEHDNNRFPNSRREEWEKIFPSFTTKEEIGLVDGLVKYNPKQRLSAAEVSGKFLQITKRLKYRMRNYFVLTCHVSEALNMIAGTLSRVLWIASDKLKRLEQSQRNGNRSDELLNNNQHQQRQIISWRHLYRKKLCNIFRMIK